MNDVLARARAEWGDKLAMLECPYGDPEYPWTTAGECSMARERSVAGQSNIIPDCPVHGPYAGEA